jgi:protein-L-isoaspartate(D-aspartate) O-methyltransferase
MASYIQQGMIETLRKKGIFSGSVLGAVAEVPRHLFVSEALRYRAYDDVSLPIGYGQTVSKPSVVGRMVQALELTGDERVLEIGTGSGYQAAVMAKLAGRVVTMERIEELFLRARSLLFSLNFSNIECILSEDFNEVEGVFDSIIVSAGTGTVPASLFRKVAAGGRLIIPVAGCSGHMIKKFIKKDDDTVIDEDIGEAVFVPYVVGESA